MILIVESGSSKTSWLVLNNGKQHIAFESIGINPYIHKREHILEVIKKEVCPYLKKVELDNIFFYGAGCSTAENKELVYLCLRHFFNRPEIEVDHDLVGAARALWGHGAGIVTILGTGSNSCYYDGEKVIELLPSLGYILGDEGSGAYMGKQIIKDYLYKKMPEPLRDKLRRQQKLDKEEILNFVYKSPNPSRWLAAFSGFIRENINDEYFQNLVYQSFYDFFDCHVSAYEEYKNKPLGAVGSIAFIYKDFLGKVGEEFGFKLTKVIKSPIVELSKFHSQHAKELSVK